MSPDTTTEAPPAVEIATPPQSAAIDTTAALVETHQSDWRTKLPENFNSDPSLKVFTSFDSEREFLEKFGGSYTELKKLVGRKLEAPNDQSTPEQVAAWRKIVGAPQKPEDYGASLKPEVLPDEQWRKEDDDGVRAIFHKHNATPGLVKDVMEFYGNSVKQGMERLMEKDQAYTASQIAALKSEWGAAYDANTAVAERFALTIGLKPDHPLFHDADVVKAMLRGTKLVSEDKLVAGTPATAVGNTRALANDIMDPISNSALARQYRGEMGPQKQMEAQDVLNNLLQADNKKAA